MGRIDITGKKFSRLTVLSYVGSSLWRCQCDCGNETLALGYQLRSGRHKSCGCLKRERIVAQSTTHGNKPRSGASPTYQSWQNMLKRCLNPDHPRYPDWGGRGITVCKRWLNFENFLADMGDKPRGLTLERINNDGNYEPGNCRWDTYHAQRVNRRTWRTPEKDRLILQLRASGLTHEAISNQVGVSRQAVRRVLRDLTA